MADDGPLDVNAEVQDAAKTVQEIGKAGPFSNLFGPAAKIVGDRIGARVQRYFDERDSRNIQAHVDAVDEDLVLLTEEITPVQFGALIEWVDSAKDVDVDDSPLLAVAWQKALLALMSDRLELLRVLPDIDEETLKAFGETRFISKRQRDQMVKSGLVEPDIELFPMVSPVLIVLTLATWLGMIGLLASAYSWMFSPHEPDTLFGTLAGLTIVFGSMLLCGGAGSLIEKFIVQKRRRYLSRETYVVNGLGKAVCSQLDIKAPEKFITK